jgi:hypothetical protein
MILSFKALEMKEPPGWGGSERTTAVAVVRY